MEVLIEEILIYGLAILFCGLILYFYLRKLKKESTLVGEKIEKAIAEGVHEPVSLHPYIDLNTCIKSGACIVACPEEDILGIRNGRATLVNASKCVGHGACFHACPVEAISLRIGTEKRGVDLPHVNQNFETNVKGIFIAGELGGMGLIKNSVEQGRQAADEIKASLDKNHGAAYDLIVIGAGPAGISASLQSKINGMKVITLEQDTLGGTVSNFPRAKIVMTNPMNLPGHGKIKLFETGKTELLELWQDVISKNQIDVRENSKVEAITKRDHSFEVTTAKGEIFTANRVLLAIGRRGTPRKLNVPGELLEKVTYRLLEPELIAGKNVLVVGGGDSAIESALLLAQANQVTLSYRSDKFSRLKPKNETSIQNAIKSNLLKVAFNTQVLSIEDDKVVMAEGDDKHILPNDLVFIFAGGELPTQFLEKIGIEIKKRFGYTVKSHKK
ncbi:MAG: NAD(P)-binding domain-containing protein [Saprospiraceae bacterium]|nr:NAD(P)-binding domain-containing protein [Saprospiraceae bacterium]